ncbi:MAG: signal peptidase II [Candidatus Nanopelagicales bacterium]|nr:signal peptidase II [Candidatus Nanopelagicales bacterium]
MIVVALVAVAVIALDQWTKSWALSTMRPRMGVGGEGPINLAGDWLRLSYVENTGAAFSLGTGVTWIFSLIAITVITVIIRTATRLGSIWWAVALGGLLGGAIGNLIDRLTRAPGVGRGYVVDFIQLPYWPVFNVADMCVVSSAILMVALTLFGVNYKGAVAPVAAA